MNKQKIAKELVKLAKAIRGDDYEHGVSTLFGKSAMELVDLEQLLRKMIAKESDTENIKVYRKIHNAVQDVIESHDKAMDMWEDFMRLKRENR